jgi:uncharacterized membrane protein YoaK (UPF0700 family)
MTESKADPDFRLLAAILSMTAGSMDVIGFLALGGLFSAHITGNIAVLAAHYVTGGFSQIGPLLSVPVFVIVLGCVTLLCGSADQPSDRIRRTLLIVHAVLLAICSGVGIVLGPFSDPDRASAVLVGMLAVVAMATQNALVKIGLKDAPSTAAMTTNTTQLVVDLATLVLARGTPDVLARCRRRRDMIYPCLGAFVAGCAIGAILQTYFGLRALAFPAGLAILAIVIDEVVCRRDATESRTLGARMTRHGICVSKT